MSFDQACKRLKGMPAEKDGVKVCKIGGKQVDTMFYDPSKETIVVKDHNERESKVKDVDEITSGTLWMIIDTPDGNAVVTNPEGKEPSFDNYIEG